MKNIFLLIIFILGFQILSAQSCGNSGSGVCTSPGLLTEPGLTPDSLIPPLVNDTISTTVIEIMGSDSITFEGHSLIIDSMHIDSLYALPGGLCYATNIPSNFLYNTQDGCIKLSGTTCSTPGQYTMQMGVTFYANFAFSTSFPILLRVINEGEAPLAFDTNGLANGTLPQFIPYGPAAPCNPTGLENVYVNNIAVKAFPNPFNNVTHIVVTGLNEKFGFELYDVTGRLQQSIPSTDNNQFDVHKGQLSNGVYLYRILVSNKPAAYGKLVIE